VWSDPGTTVLGSPVESGGLVIGAALLGDGTSGLAAWDAGTGRQVWFAAGPPDSYVGPAVAGGTVVWADGAGVVHALDARTGTETWSLDLRRPAGGVPVIRDGRVYLATLGRPEDLDQRDYRVLALDLQTGRFEGSWEPPTTQNWIVPPVSAGTEDDALLVPTAYTGSTRIVGVGPRG
jgi:outer membrane protein assembly factor BamB